MDETTGTVDKPVCTPPPTAWQVLMLVLSLYVLVALLAELLMERTNAADPDVLVLLHKLDNGICLVFLGDFFFRLFRAPKKVEFLKWNWIDFVSSIPAWDALRIGRLVRVLRVLRALRSAKFIAAFIFKNRWGGLTSAAALCFVFVTFAAVAILSTERSPDSNIKTAADALWWALTTVTTVGYGDRYPVTPEGRIVAAFLMVAGAGLFGILSGAIASIFLRSDAQDTHDELSLLRNDLVRLQDQIEFLQKKMAEEEELVRLTHELRELRLALSGRQEALQTDEAATAAGAAPQTIPPL